MNRTLTRHGKCTHPIYRVWQAMKRRCYNPNTKEYQGYGGRGIRVCRAWHYFPNFWRDMHHTYKPGLQLDRQNNDLGYNKRNCRWTTASQQQRNRRNTRVLPTPKGKMSYLEAEEVFGVPASRLKSRVEAGWSPKNYFLPPQQGKRCF